MLWLAVLFPASSRVSIALSLSSNRFSKSAMMVSMAAWVMGASRTSCRMPVGLGAVEGMLVLVVVVEEEEEEDGVACCCGGAVSWGVAAFPLFFVFVASC